MNGKKNVALLIDVYSQYGGASKAAIRYASVIREYGYNSFVICNNVLSGEHIEDNVYELNNVKKCRDFFSRNSIDVVHFFKSQKSLLECSIFKKAVKAIRQLGKDIRVLITICQQPSYGREILTPFEISNCDYLFFIDKTAYNDPMFGFIPKDRKTWMYLTASKSMIHHTEVDELAKQDYGIKNNTIVFGRGSTLNKCPKDTIDIYDRITVPYNKKFVIVGVPESDNWLTKKIKKRTINDIQTYPMQLPVKYSEIISSFDILLYYLPNNSYSSRDGSLREAMRLGLPVVVYGAPAPKEAVTNGIDGFVAETKEDFIKYAEMLANNLELRETLGRNARRLYFENAPEIHWTKAYTEIMNKVCKEPKRNKIKCPVGSAIKINFIRYISWIATVTRKGFNAIIKFF